MGFNMNCSKPDHFAGKVDLIWVRISNIRKKCNHMGSFTPMYSILRPPSFSNALWKTQFNIYSVNWYTKTVLSNLEKIILASNFKNDILLFLFHSNKCFFDLKINQDLEINQKHLKWVVIVSIVDIKLSLCLLWL